MVRVNMTQLCPSVFLAKKGPTYLCGVATLTGGDTAKLLV
jgi:hypothetical protein